MIEIVHAGQFGKAALLLDMHRLRKKVFYESLQWPVTVIDDELEVDQFDLPEALYILYLDPQRRVTGTIRMVPTTGPTMMREVWPHFLQSLPMPRKKNAWEISRFTIAPLPDTDRQSEAKRALGELFLGLVEFCLHIGIKEIYSFYDNRIARVIRRIDCTPQMLSQTHNIDDRPAQLGRFIADETMLRRIRKASGITQPVLNDLTLPPQFASDLAREFSYAI